MWAVGRCGDHGGLLARWADQGIRPWRGIRRVSAATGFCMRAGRGRARIHWDTQRPRGAASNAARGGHLARFFGGESQSSLPPFQRGNCKGGSRRAAIAAWRDRRGKGVAAWRLGLTS
ncbi:hypothetical protein GLA29479_2263 [Lysobacter antibioticus]|nr:hypothetical protein GLA29479_2263 [Lysobacter antibioticus]